jgi:hypothetical protein
VGQGVTEGSLTIFEMQKSPKFRSFQRFQISWRSFNSYPFMNLHVKVPEALIDIESLEKLAR